MRDFLLRTGLDNSGGGLGSEGQTVSRRRLSDVPRTEVLKQGPRLAKATHIQDGSVRVRGDLEGEGAVVRVGMLAPAIAFRALKALFCHRR
ncbi:hypothetical protein ACFRAI_43595 [Streptomyces sp. NPDC056637]|uniref:hypothetical protein n=1 Tax=unclassified Streptomyces TaxID=2593676 RepID=UPI0036B76497